MKEIISAIKRRSDRPKLIGKQFVLPGFEKALHRSESIREAENKRIIYEENLKRNPFMPPISWGGFP